LPEMSLLEGGRGTETHRRRGGLSQPKKKTKRDISGREGKGTSIRVTGGTRCKSGEGEILAGGGGRKGDFFRKKKYGKLFRKGGGEGCPRDSEEGM